MPNSIKFNFDDKSKKELQEVLSITDKLFTNLEKISTKKIKVQSSKELAAEQEKANTTTKKSIDLTTQLEKAQRDLLLAQTKEGKQLVELRTEKAKLNAETRKQYNEATAVLDAEQKLNKEVNAARKTYINYAKTLGETNKKTIEAQKRAAELADEQKRLNANAKNFKPNVGNYPQQLGITTKAVNLLKGAMSGLVVLFGVRQLFEYGKQLNQIAIEAKGVQFAFDRLGQSGVDALNNIKSSTRGLISNLDIKKSLVEFDNFNISLEQTDTLFEFLAVRATQTGQSIDSLKSSLVEGLSKESKLRIDNLGISTAELNAELEKTPNFVEAVANIAKKEIAEAGDILDEAASSQEKWNAQIENTKEVLATKLKPTFDGLFTAANASLNFITNNFKTLLTTVKSLAAGFVAYKVVLVATSNFTKAYTAITTALRIAKIALSGGITKAMRAMKLFNIVTKANPLGLLATAIGLVVAGFVAFRSGADEATKAQLRLNKAIEDGKNAAKENAEALNEYLQQEVEKINEKERALKAVAQTEKQENTISKSAISEKVALYEKEQLAIVKRIALLKQQAFEYGENTPKGKEFTEQAKAEAKTYEELSKRIKSLTVDKLELKKTETQSGGGSGGTNDTNFGNVTQTQAEEIDRLTTDIQGIIEKSSRKITDILDTQVDMITQSYQSGYLTAAQYIQELEKVQENASRDTVEYVISDLEEILESANLSVEERKDAEATLYEFKQRLRALDTADITQKAQDEVAANEAKNKKIKDDEKKTAEERKAIIKQIAQATITAASMVGDELFSQQTTRLENELSLAQKRYDYEILLAESSGESTEAINARKLASAEVYARKEAQIKEKQARADKAQAMFNAIINTAAAVTTTLASLGVPAGIAPAAIAGALGAVEIALIASRPIPKFKTGVEDFEGGLATVGDGGRELVRLPNKEMLLVERETTLNLPKGTDVIKNSETEKMLKGNGMSETNSILRTIASKKSKTVIYNKIVNKSASNYDLKRRNN